MVGRVDAKMALVEPRLPHGKLRLRRPRVRVLLHAFTSVANGRMIAGPRWVRGRWEIPGTVAACDWCGTVPMDGAPMNVKTELMGSRGSSKGGDDIGFVDDNWSSTH